MSVFVDADPGNTCFSGFNSPVYRSNPGATNQGSPGGPVAGYGIGTYGWLSGCVSRGGQAGVGAGFAVLGAFANGGDQALATTAIGFNARALTNFTTAFGVDALATGVASIALGAGSVSTGSSAIAIGGGGASVLDVANSTTASGVGAIAVGVNATKGALAVANNAVAFGGESAVIAGSTSGVAIGRGALTQAPFGVALGDGAATGATGNNVAIGASGTTANATDGAGGAVAIGRGQKASGNGAVAVGDPNVASGAGAVALGADNTAAGDAAGATAADGAVAIGNANAAIGTGNIAIGSNNTATNARTVALGVGASTTNDDALALGVGTSAVAAGGVALGANSLTGTAVIGTLNAVIGGVTYDFAGTAPASTVSVGAPGAERTITNVAAGRISATSTDGINASQLFATNQAIEIASLDVNTIASKWIVGSPVTYVQPVSVGTNSTAAGSGASAIANNSVAVGTGARATTDNSVALGNGATTSAAAGTSSITIRGTTYDFAGTDPSGVVSVGSAGSERQIQNVAAGRIGGTSTDAVNGSQFFATTLAINGLVATSNEGVNITTAATGTGVANGTTVARLAPAGTATYTAGNNMVLTQNGTNVAFAVSERPTFTTVSVEGGPSLGTTGIDAGGQTVGNVAPAVDGTDAVNLNQLNFGVASAAAGLQDNLDRTARKAYAGVAGALSMENAPFVAGKLTYGAGVGYYQSEGAVGLALRRTSDNGRWSLLGGLSASSGGVGARVSYAMVWD